VWQGEVDRLSRKLEQLRSESSTEAQKELLATTEKLAIAQDNVSNNRTELEKVGGWVDGWMDGWVGGWVGSCQ
jgi:hypothetical protein